MDILNLKTHQILSIKGSEITEHIKAAWEKIHSNTSVFRYKINTIQERIVDKKYLLQLNPNRNTKRRTPEQITNISQQFDENKFNFTKVSDEEIMFKFKIQNNEGIHTLLVNVSPITLYHTLLCPSMSKQLPQVITKESLKLVIDLILLAEDRNLRIGFNSLCALASVNHLHYHLFFEKNNLPVETVKCKHIKSALYCFQNYPVPAFCFQIEKGSAKIDEIYQLLEFFLQKSIPHNIFLTRGDRIETDDFENGESSYRFVIWPRKSSSGAKQFPAFNIGVCELSGWFPIYSTEDFYHLKAVQLESELVKWKERFAELCEDVKSLY